jgi:hypothetical protein
MKTTIELPDALLDRCRVVARREGGTLKSLMEEGLQRVLAARETSGRTAGAKARSPIRPFRGDGLTEAFEGASWERIRDEIYR